LKFCSPDMAVAACMSFSNSMKAIPGRASTMRTCGVVGRGEGGGRIIR
jgi:hypothetical protein